MPLYEYACSKCGAINEVMQKISDPPPKACPSCGGRKLERVISRTSFQLKGGGWYAEGYASGGKKDASSQADSGTKSEGTSTAKSETKTTESKPAESKATESKPTEAPKVEAKAPEAKKPAKTAKKA